MTRLQKITLVVLAVNLLTIGFNLGLIFERRIERKVLEAKLAESQARLKEQCANATGKLKEICGK